MRTFAYRADKTALAGVFMAALAIGAGKMWWNDQGFWFLIIGLAMAAGAVKIAADVMNPAPVLRYDRQSLWVRTTFGAVEEIPWRNVHGISLNVLTMKYMGFIPLNKTEFLEIRCEGGAFATRRLRVSIDAMDLPPGGAKELTLTLQAAHVDAVGAAGVAMAGAGDRGWGVDLPAANQGPQFDPDAAIARYLAAKNESEPGAIAPAPARPAIAQRPVFGRRVR